MLNIECCLFSILVARIKRRPERNQRINKGIDDPFDIVRRAEIGILFQDDFADDFADMIAVQVDCRVQGVKNEQGGIVVRMHFFLISVVGDRAGAVAFVEFQARLVLF